MNRGIAVGDANLVRRAVAQFESVLAATSPGDANHAIAAANASNALVIEFELTGRADALDRAITLLDDLGPDAAALGPRQADFFSILGHALLATPSASRGSSRRAEIVGDSPCTIWKNTGSRLRAIPGSGAE